MSVYISRQTDTCTYLLLAPVVGGQVCGALSVVSPSAVDTGHLLPVPQCITLAVGLPWRSEHSHNVSATVFDTEENVLKQLLIQGLNISCFYSKRKTHQEEAAGAFLRVSAS